MILTRVVKHHMNFTSELKKAKLIAEYAISQPNYMFSSKEVKHIGLKSVLANQVMKKYGRDKRARIIKSMVLPIPRQGFKYENEEIYIPSLKVRIQYHTDYDILSLELSRDKLYVIQEVPELPAYESTTMIGVDLNSTSYVAVSADLCTGKVKKLGRNLPHIRKKYKNLRRKMQAKNRFGVLKRLNNKEQRVKKDAEHKISRSLVNAAYESKASLVLEDLKGIRRQKTWLSKASNDVLHSWPFYSLQQKIEYKAKLLGVPVFYINPYNTSATCSRCGSVGDRDGKKFKCSCGHIDHADSNAAFNIAKLGLSLSSSADKERSTDTRKRQRGSRNCPSTQEPQVL